MGRVEEVSRVVSPDSQVISYHDTIEAGAKLVRVLDGEDTDFTRGYRQAVADLVGELVRDPRVLASYAIYGVYNIARMV